MWGNDRGQLVLEADEVDPIGEGAVAAMIAETRARLAAEGLLDRPRRPVPRLPRVIGVLCGSEAAVRKDIESVVAARFPGYPLAVEETTVSGPGAAVSIIDALQRLSCRPEVDVVVLARGGGDATALLPWSDEELCRAVAACPVPVVSAIGHESDRPLCDEVADLRFGTPSIAAHAVVPDRRKAGGRTAGSGRGREASGAAGELGRERLKRAEVGGALAAGLERAGEPVAPRRRPAYSRAPRPCRCKRAGRGSKPATGAGRWWRRLQSQPGPARSAWAAMPVRCLPSTWSSGALPSSAASTGPWCAGPTQVAPGELVGAHRGPGCHRRPRRGRAGRLVLGAQPWVDSFDPKSVRG